jgi:hypothetical protein
MSGERLSNSDPASEIASLRRDFFLALSDSLKGDKPSAGLLDVVRKTLADADAERRWQAERTPPVPSNDQTSGTTTLPPDVARRLPFPTNPQSKSDAGRGAVAEETELRPYSRTIHAFQAANFGHPALAIAYDELNRLLTDAAAVPVTFRPKPREWRTRLRLDLQRLHSAGLTGREMFEIAAALHLFAVSQPRSLAPWSREFWFQLSRLLLNSRQRKPRCNPLVSKYVQSRLPANALEHLGRTITTVLAGILRAMVATIERHAKAPQEIKEQIAQAVASTPFTTPQPTSPITQGINTQCPSSKLSEPK